jgi:beta-lactamase regulating signal transducer with metallopeptidase domain
MERLLFECAIRAILIAASTALILWFMRIKAAAVRHRSWTGVVLLMLVLPISTALGPGIPIRVLPPVPVSAEAPSGPVSVHVLPPPLEFQSSAGATPVGLPETPPIPARATAIEGRSLLLGVYLTGALVMLLRLAIGTIQAHRLIRSAILQDGRLTSGSCTTPITVGWFNPVVILPIEWQQWPEEQLNAILTHENEHANRYHPFAQWMALLNRAVFWFHPLAWWLERKMAALSEEACDAAVLAAGHSPQDYSDYLLDLARSMMRDGKRVQVVGMAMPGSCLKMRICQILSGVPAQRISRTRIVGTVASCMIASVVLGAATLASREVTPINPTGEVVAVTDSVSQDSLPSAPEPQTPAPADPTVLVESPATDASTPAAPEVATVSIEQSATAPPTPQSTEQLKAEEAPPRLTPSREDTNGPAITTFLAEIGRILTAPPQVSQAAPPVLVPSPAGLGTSGGVVLTSMQTPAWWTDPQLILRLGLTDDQRAKIERAYESHRPSILSSRENLRNEEARQARLLEADPVDGQAVLAQIDRVVEARAQVERASAAMNLEVRGYLTPVQWMQLRAQVPITTIDYVARRQPTPGIGLATTP